ncbi:MAG TPA: hypothetical protein VGV12_04760 [Gemmatimonadales bacterium]|nr:hypothetical protein [Gemmatimonadales bacterium]
MTTQIPWVSAFAATALLGCGGNGTGPTGASLTVNNHTASATLSLDVGSNPTVVIAAGQSICQRFSSTMDTTVFTITVNTTDGTPASQDFDWVTATDPHLTIIAADLSGAVALAEGPGGSC